MSHDSKKLYNFQLSRPCLTSFTRYFSSAHFHSNGFCFWEVFYFQTSFQIHPNSEFISFLISIHIHRLGFKRAPGLIVCVFSYITHEYVMDCYQKWPMCEQKGQRSLFKFEFSAHDNLWGFFIHFYFDGILTRSKGGWIQMALLVRGRFNHLEMRFGLACDTMLSTERLRAQFMILFIYQNFYSQYLFT